MIPPALPTGDPRTRTAMLALALTLAIQVFTALVATAASVLAPEIGRDLGISPKLIGVFVGIMYVGSMTASLASGMFIERHGAIRVSQVCVLLCATGLLVVAVGAEVPGVALAALAVAPLIIGLGYGPITPASSQVLARTARPSRMALTFSIKQTGVPAGAALAGAVLPFVAVRIGWQAAFALVAVSGILIALGAQTARATLDAGRAPAHVPSLARIAAPLRHVWRTPALLELGTVAFIYAGLQACLMSFLVVYLTESLAFSLVAAGFALTVANLGGIVGRILWGAIADFRLPPRALLGLLGIAAGTGAWATVTFTAGWPIVAILAVCACFGVTAIGWNGVQLAEVARHAPAGQVGAITGAASFITFGGVVVAPPAFALIAALTGGYRAGFAVFGGLSIACGIRLLARPRK
jgi:predicted MFS family arabinose efflux permease